jgi:hypothetical protein
MTLVNRVIFVIFIIFLLLYSVETTYGINSVISKLMTFVENAETGQFLFLIALILSCYDVICSFFGWRSPLFSSVLDRPSYCLNDGWKKLLAYITIFLRKRQILIQKFNLIFNVKILIDLKQKQQNI